MPGCWRLSNKKKYVVNEGIKGRKSSITPIPSPGRIKTPPKPDIIDVTVTTPVQDSSIVNGKIKDTTPTNDTTTDITNLANGTAEHRDNTNGDSSSIPISKSKDSEVNISKVIIEQKHEEIISIGENDNNTNTESLPKSNYPEVNRNDVIIEQDEDDIIIPIRENGNTERQDNTNTESSPKSNYPEEVNRNDIIFEQDEDDIIIQVPQNGNTERQDNTNTESSPKSNYPDNVNTTDVIIEPDEDDKINPHENGNTKVQPIPITDLQNISVIEEEEVVQRRSGVLPVPVDIVSPKDDLPNYPKTSDDEILIKSAIEKNDFLSRIIKKRIMDEVIAAMYNMEITANAVIIKQGDKGAHMYVSAKGNYQIIVKGKVVDEFKDNRVFGELAILYSAKRLATIKALSDGRVWVLDQKVYQNIVYRHNIKEQDEIMELLLKTDKLKSANKKVLQAVANLLKKEFFAAGTKIVRQGDKGNTFYIIRAGTVTITKEGEGIVGVYKKGDCFGELALLKEDCRQATVTADPPGVDCLAMTRRDFINHFGELENFKDATAAYEPRDSIRSLAATGEFADINMDDLRIVTTIGVGGFGRVELVQHRKQKDVVFALKYLKKVDIVLQHQQDHVYNEKVIQMACKSPFIVKMYKTYKDDKYIYFLMEVCLGGDLWSLLQRQKNRRFEEKDARFICACVIEAFDFLHARGIVYRDLKPENLLIDRNGYVKLTDFGFAKKVPSRGRTFTFAGTPEYVAPEIVLNRGHDRAVDYWAYGAFVFEMLTGRTPFRTDDSSHMRTYNKILGGIDNVSFPSYVNPKAKFLIERLCRPVPSERLGMQRGGIKDIKANRWFLGFDWQKLQNHEIPSPFKPKLKGPTDTKYFDTFKRDNDDPPDEKSGWDVKF